MTTGKYSTPNRTGASSNSALELIYRALLAARGTAYSDEDGTIIAAETFGYAKSITETFNANERMGNQWDPVRMGVFIPRWEAIFGITPAPTASINSRKQAIASYFAAWSQQPTMQQMADILKSILGNIFIKLEYYLDSENLGSVPGGATIPGGSTYTSNTWGGLIPGGVWMSYVNQIVIHVWQPRDHSNNKLISNQDFHKTLKQASAFLYRWLPAYTDFKYKQRPVTVSGTITTTAGSTAVVGIGTAFTSEFSASKRFSSIDDAGNYQDYTILSITDNTNLTLNANALSNNTGGVILYEGFFLDTPNNLDSQTLSTIDILKP
jgi:hypothetical protein